MVELHDPVEDIEVHDAEATTSAENEDAENGAEQVCRTKALVRSSSADWTVSLRMHRSRQVLFTPTEVEQLAD